jgi:cyanophycinase
MALKHLPFLILALVAVAFGCSNALAASYKYIRVGNKQDVETTPVAGTALMGGGSDLDEAFRWLCARTRGGDFLVLRARGDDDYNAYVQGLCQLNSVATLIIPGRKAAGDPQVADIIRHAETVFIAGGDQSRYIRFWRGTPVQDALNAHIATGKPIGGTSAGLAVLGEFTFAALHDSAISKDVLRNPFDKRVTLTNDFLRVPLLEKTITDSHFVARDRLGRTLVFLARLIQDGQAKEPRAIAVDEKAAALVEPDGASRVVGTGLAYFLKATTSPEICRAKTPLTFRSVLVYRVPVGGHFNLSNWTGDGGSGYLLSVEQGVIHSTQSGGSAY